MLNTLVLLIKRQSNVFKTIFYQVILICLSDDTHTQEGDKKSFAQDVFKVYSQVRTCSMQRWLINCTSDEQLGKVMRDQGMGGADD